MPKSSPESISESSSETDSSPKPISDSIPELGSELKSKSKSELEANDSIKSDATTSTYKAPSYITPNHNNNDSKIFWADFRLFVICFGTGGFIGLSIEQLPWGLLAGLLAFFIWRFIAMQRFLQWVNAPVATPPPELSGGLSYVADKLYQSRTKEKLTHQKMMGLVKKIRSSLLALQDAVILLDKEDKLEWWNQSAEKLLHIKSINQGEHIFNLINLDEFHEYYSYTKNTKNSQNDGVRLQYWHDNERYLQCELTLFGEEKLLIIYDVTRMQHLEQMRKDFVGNVSHELRTPLTVLMGYIETFSDQPDIDPKWKRGFSLMTQQTKRMNSIVNDLLMLSRLENQEKLKTDCVDMPLMLTHLFDDAQMYNKDYNHFIDLHIDSQLNLIASETYLNSALLNLVTNALKYTEKGGEIHISWSEVKGGCMFSVSDNGYGIAPEHLDRLTERFYRVDSGRSRSTGGTGLGLAIVKHVLYQHDAELKVESTEGKGSTFKVFFPKTAICYDRPCND